MFIGMMAHTHIWAKRNDLIKRIVKLSSQFKAHQKWFAFEIASDYIPLLQTRLQSLYHSLPPLSASTCDACAMLLVAKKLLEKQKSDKLLYSIWPALAILWKIYWGSSLLDIGSPFQFRLTSFAGHYLSIRSIRYEFFLAFFMNGCRISSLALGRFSGSLFRQVSTNSLNCFEKLPVSWGGLFFGIRKRTLIGCRSELGGSPCKWTRMKKKLELSSRVDCEMIWNLCKFYGGDAQAPDVCLGVICRLLYHLRKEQLKIFTRSEAGEKGEGRNCIWF